MSRFLLKKLASRPVLSTALLGALTLGISQCQPSFAEAAASKALTNQQLNELIHQPSVGARATSVRAVGNGPMVTVLAEEKAAAQDNDLKVDAMFLARTLIEGAPGQIEKVKVLFTQTGKAAQHVTVTRGAIADFGAGRKSASELLNSLILVKVETTTRTESAPEIPDGPEMERRALLWGRIETLREQGTGIAPFEAIFKEIQGLAKANDAEKVSQKLAYLESKVAGQEEQARQAKESLRGRGVPAVKSAANGAGTGKGATGTTPQTTPPTQSAASGYIPPEAEHLKSVFNSQANEIISQVTRKNPSEGYRLRDMKSEIDKLFNSHQDAKAFELLHSFDQAAAKVTGASAFGPGGQGGGVGPGGGMGPGGGGMGPGAGPPGGGPPF